MADHLDTAPAKPNPVGSLRLLRGAKGVSDFTGLPIRTVRHLINTGKIPVHRFGDGRNQYFLPDEIRASAGIEE